jgi:hypothetical protein
LSSFLIQIFYFTEKLDGNYSYLLNKNGNNEQPSMKQEQTFVNTDVSLHRNDEQISICLEPSEGLEVII